MADLFFGLIVAVPAFLLIATFVVEKRRRTGPDDGTRPARAGASR